MTFCTLGAAESVSAELSVLEWQEDIDQLVHVINVVHPNPFSDISRESFEAAAQQIRDNSHQRTDLENSIALMQLVAKVGDGHSSVEPTGIDAFNKWYPLRFFRFTDGIHITAISAQFRMLVGAKVLEIGEVSADEAWKRTATLRGADNEFGSLKNAALFLSNAAALKALGITEHVDELSLVVQLPGKDSESVSIPVVDSEFDLSFQYWGEIWGPGSEDTEYVAAFGKPSDDFYDESSSLPLHLRYRSAFWNHYDPEKKLFYVQVNFMGDSSRRNQTFEEFVKALFDQADALEIEKFVVDLRYNIGGDGSLVNSFVHELIKHESINQAGKLFVITGRDTFSAGVMLVHALDEHTEATFVGEPPGAYYQHFGDATNVVLSNSGITLWVSTIYHQLSAYTRLHQVMPIEFPAQFSAAEYFAGADPALDVILKSSEQPPLIKMFRDHGSVEALREYDKRQQQFGSVLWWAPFTLDELDGLGDEFRTAQKWDDALAIYELNASRHPDHWRVWHSLAGLHAELGNSESALENYHKALEADPYNNLAIEQRTRISELE